MLNDSELIRECKEFNEAAQRALYYKYAPSLKAFCFRYCGDKEEAKDILQDSFIKIFSKIGSFSDKGSLEGWMKKIVLNTFLQHYKKSKNSKHVSIDQLQDVEDDDTLTGDPALGVEEPIVGEFTEEQLLNALKTLPDPYRIVFNMFHIEEFSHKEISETLSIDEKTSRTRLYRGKKLLQKYLSGIHSKKLASK